MQRLTLFPKLDFQLGNISAGFSSKFEQVWLEAAISSARSLRSLAALWGRGGDEGLLRVERLEESLRVSSLRLMFTLVRKNKSLFQRMDLSFSQEPKIVFQNKKFRSYVKYLRLVGTQYSVTKPSSTKKSETPVLTHQLGISSCMFLGFCRKVYLTNFKPSKWKDFLTRRWKCWSFIDVLEFVGVIQLLAERLFPQKRWQLKTKSIKDSKFCLSEWTCCECVFKSVPTDATLCKEILFKQDLPFTELQIRPVVGLSDQSNSNVLTIYSCMWRELGTGNSFRNTRWTQPCDDPPPL